MKIAFDVKGMLDGRKSKEVMIILKAFEAAGHGIFVWSNSYNYARDFVRDNNLSAWAINKVEKNGYDGEEEKEDYMDLAIEDDTNQTWLATKRFVWVDDIPTDTDELNEFVENLLNLYK